MKTIRICIQPETAFGSPLKGDTLFGQLCWALRNRWGEASLKQALEGYTSGQPFAVVSDAFPSGFLPRPVLPVQVFDTAGLKDRKLLKKRRWIGLDTLDKPMEQWLLHGYGDAELPGEDATTDFARLRLQPHNSIDRRSGTTGDGFAPYGMLQTWYRSGQCFDMYCLLDETRLSLSDFRRTMEDIGLIGFGRDASIGLGKFSLRDCAEIDWPAQAQADAALTLAPCAPQGLSLDAKRSFYSVFTRFGRHGDRGVLLGNPFKAPVLLADVGAVLSPLPQAHYFVGQGLGGEGRISKTISDTVQQGYAPIVPVRLPQSMEMV